jgi:dihydrofolate reductase/thymidylate synthase
MSDSEDVVNAHDAEYLRLVRKILEFGETHPDRTGTGTISLFGQHMEFDISASFPLLTVKHVNFDNILDELLWFLSGSTNTKDLQTRIWDANSSAEFLAKRNLPYEPGQIGPSYGHQWRRLPGNDQIAKMIETIQLDPNSRRNLLSSWAVCDIDKMALPPCHIMFQVYVREGQILDGHLYQRSADMFLGVPYNIASYATLLYILCGYTQMRPGKLYMSFGDTHIYLNHIAKCHQMCKLPSFDPPSMVFWPNPDGIDAIVRGQFELYNYEHGPKLFGKLAV